MIDNYQILIADDDQEDHMILLEYFRASQLDGYVKFVTNGQQAIEFLETIDDDALLPKLIVLDLNMPIMNGTQTLLFLKQTGRFKNIPIVIYSTSENTNEKRKCFSFGAIDYIVKPSTYEDGQLLVDRLAGFITQ